MGLDTSHDAFSGSYGSFMRWRREIAKAAGMPPLELMEGFFVPQRKDADVFTGQMPTIFLDHTATDLARSSLALIEERLPIRWNSLKYSPLHRLLYHSDCDGKISSRYCGPIANALEKLIPLLPEDDAGGHIGNWRKTTQQFVNGLRTAAAAHEPLKFR